MDQFTHHNALTATRTSAAFSPALLRHLTQHRIPTSLAFTHVTTQHGGNPGTGAMHMHAQSPPPLSQLSRVCALGATTPSNRCSMRCPSFTPTAVAVTPASAAVYASRSSFVGGGQECSLLVGSSTSDAGGGGVLTAVSTNKTVQVGTRPPAGGSSGPSGGGWGGPDGGGSNNNGGDNQFALNFGEAVNCLVEDLPCLFERDPRFHIFRDDLTFRTPSMRYSTGLWKYKVLHRAVRYLGNLLYADMSLSLQRMWQPAGNRQQLRVRWCVSGRPRLALSTEDMSTEVISTYTFDSKGKIYQHQVDQIIPPESMLVRLFDWLVGRLQPGMVLPQPGLPLPGLRDSLH